jgi:hypothetical protein
MAYEMALSMVNQTQKQLAAMARAIANALADGKVTPWEGMALSMTGMSLATHLMTLLQGVDATTRADLLHVLEYGQWTLPEST